MGLGLLMRAFLGRLIQAETLQQDDFEVETVRRLKSGIVERLVVGSSLPVVSNGIDPGL